MEFNSRTEKTENDSVDNNNNVNSLQASKVSKENKQASKLQNLGTRIPAQTLQRFRSFVIFKHRKLNGPFSQEIAKALEFWMDNQQQTTSYTTSLHNKSGRMRADVKEKYLSMSFDLKQLTSYPLVNVPTLKAVVKKTLGNTDKRTFEKYLKTIVRFSKEQHAPNGTSSLFDVTKFVEKIQGDDW